MTRRVKLNNWLLLFRRPPSPESPQPYTATEQQSSSLFSSSKDDVAPLKSQELIEYIRQFNKEHSSCKLGIWQATRSSSKDLKNPAILRFSIKDVLTTYLTVSYTADDPTLSVESVTAFGPRERVSAIEICPPDMFCAEKTDVGANHRSFHTLSRNIRCTELYHKSLDE